MKTFLRKALGALALAAMLLPLGACGGTGGGNDGDDGGGTTPTVAPVSCLKTTEGGRRYIEMDGKPFTYIGGQLRVDGYMDQDKQTIDDMEKYFKLAAETNVNVVELPIQWKDIEPEKDVYEFKNVGKLLGFAKKYGLKAELLLFTVNVCGSSSVAPQYIESDANTYPRYPSNVKGTVFYEQDNPNLLDRESKAVRNLMNAVASWCKAAGENVVLAVQVHNEPDVFPLWRLKEQNVLTLDGSRKLTDIEAWDETLYALDYIGKVVKSSDYPCLTRVNTAIAWRDRWESFVPRIYELEGIDMVGDDTYNETVVQNKQVMINLSTGKLANNLPHVAENRGSYASTPSCILGTVCAGGGYLIYDLITAKTFVDDWGWPDEGLIDPYDHKNPDSEGSMRDKPHTELTRSVLYGIKYAGYPMTLANVEDIAGFNLKGNYPETTWEQTISTSSVRITYSTENGSLGFAAVYGGYVTLYTTDAATFTLANGAFSGAEIGVYKTDGTFVKSADAEITNGKLTLAAKQICRVKIDRIDGALLSDALSNIG